jgi:UDP-N-acetylglucosamine 2-epimerase (non-hydrolysing)
MTLGHGSSAVPRIVMLAGTRAEAAALAPVARAMNEVGRLEAVPVAAGVDPMEVDEALVALGSTAHLVSLVRGCITGPVEAAAALAVRTDELLADQQPSAVVLTGGGMMAVVGAQVAFRRNITVVYLEPGPNSRDQNCPLPSGANRRVVGQLTSLFLLASERRAPWVSDGPAAITVGDTLADVALESAELSPLAGRVADGHRLALLDLRSRATTEQVAELLDGDPDLEVVFFHSPSALQLPVHPRLTVLPPDPPLTDLLALVRMASVGATDRGADYCGYSEAVDLGLPPMGERGRLVTQLADRARDTLRTPDSQAARRAEHALAWMVGLEERQVPTPPLAGVLSGAPDGPEAALLSATQPLPLVSALPPRRGVAPSRRSNLHHRLHPHTTD